MLKRGGLRILTGGEISLAQELYSFSIRYNQVWVHHGSYLPFSMQDKDTIIIRYKNYDPRESIKELIAKYQRVIGNFSS
ncbi:hypothetical protein [Rouxiella sp. Mn2063]|uniref:hypothetical protein n=1 Tax=Rouxiella sp. Mn2063 TaxID=3395262 RepID=UPI003BBDCEA4